MLQAGIKERNMSVIRQKKELPLNFFYYSVNFLDDEMIFEKDPNGFSDYLLILRWRSGVRRGETIETENQPNCAR
jgi:hypothetical protein